MSTKLPRELLFFLLYVCMFYSHLCLSLCFFPFGYTKKTPVIINSPPSLPHKSNPCSKICHLLPFFGDCGAIAQQANTDMEMWREKHFYLRCQITAYCLWIQGSFICLVRTSRSLWPISVTYALQTYIFVNDDKSMTQHLLKVERWDILVYTLHRITTPKNSKDIRVVEVPSVRQWCY